MKATNELVRLEDYQPTPYAIPIVELDFKLEATSTLVHSTLHFKRRDGIPAGTPLELDGDELSLVSVKVDETDLPEGSYTCTPEKLVIASPPDKTFKLDIVTKISPETNTQLMGLYRSTDTYCTQCEAEGFRRITYFFDRPDVLSVYTTRIEADKEMVPILLSNGNPIEAGDIENTNRHFALWHDPFPKPSYLFALVAGDLASVRDSFTTASGRIVELVIYVEHGKEDRCGYAMDALKRSMKWDEEVFGREYDLDLFNIVAVSSFNMGAMENKGLNVFNDSCVLADPDTATDSDFARVETVIAHEYFHNWTGNRITCRDWFQLCLKEGLTVFRDQEFTSDERSRPVKRISDVRTLWIRQFPEDAGPLAHPVRPNQYQEISNFYTATVYEKGAEVIRMLKILVGDDGFRKGMDLYFIRHDGMAATMENFLTCFSEETGTNLEQFLLWYEQAGTPLVTSNSEWDSSTGTFKLHLEQTIDPTPGQSEKKPMVIPIKFGLVGPNGQDMDYSKAAGANIRDDVIILTDQEQTVTFNGLSTKPVPSLFRQFSAPVKPRNNLTTKDMLFLLQHDNDPFNRWQISQKLALDHLIEATNEIRAGNPYQPDSEIINGFEPLIFSNNLDNAFKALAIKVPGEDIIAQEIGKNVDPDAIFTARNGFRRAIANEYKNRMLTEYLELNDQTPYSPDAESAGRREFRLGLLSFLALGFDDEEGDTIVSDHYKSSSNMTDRASSLSILVVNQLPDAESALESFFDRYQGDSLVLDKWFTIQAVVPGAQTLEKVKQLSRHPAFSFSRPNCLRALFSTFAIANPTGFNRADGAGYDYIADIVIKLDSSNPQVAARLLTCFGGWKSMEATRMVHAENSLTRIAELPSLSNDVSDIVKRTLAT